MVQQYNSNMRASAHRHLEAAEKLLSNGRADVAGYLFGIAAECGLKGLMLALGMRPMPEDQRRDDPFYAHFSDLKRMLRDSAAGRRQVDLRKYAENDAFMSHWDISMRYSDGKDIRESWIERWHADAKAIIGEI